MSFFTLTLDFSQKVSGKGAIANDLFVISTISGNLVVFLVQIARKSKPSQAPAANTENLYYTVTDAIVLSIFYASCYINTNLTDLIGC